VKTHTVCSACECVRKQRMLLGQTLGMRLKPRRRMLWHTVSIPQSTVPSSTGPWGCVTKPPSFFFASSRGIRPRCDDLTSLAQRVYRVSCKADACTFLSSIGVSLPAGRGRSVISQPFHTTARDRRWWSGSASDA